MSIHSARLLTAGAWLVCLFPAADRAWSREDPDVLVTASRVSESRADLLWSSTVLTRADIEARQALSVQELLAGLAGVGLQNNGGLGKATTVFMRGAESDQTLLLVDGVRVGSATLGLPPFELIPIEQIERIEIVRGPRSTLYGSDAVGGVVQIFTRSRPSPGLTGGAALGAGSDDLRRLSAHLGAAGARAWVSLGGEGLETDGIDSCAGLPFPPGGGCFTDEPDRDGFRTRAVSVAAGAALGERLSAELRSLHAEGRTEYDGTFTNVTDFVQRAVSVHLAAELSDAWTLRAVLGRNDDDQKNLLERTPVSRFESRRNTASVQLDGRLGGALRAVLGADRADDRITSTEAFERTSRASTGLFGELRAERAAWTGLAGVRLEDNEQFGSHLTGNLGAARRLGERVRLTATWGTAFRAPTFNELYFPFFGNPQLEPEESRSLELGVEAAVAATRWALNVYETRIEELISFDAATFSSRNIASARIRGAELQGEWRAASWLVSGQVTLLEPANHSAGGDFGNVLPRRAQAGASLEVRRAFGGGTPGGSGWGAGTVGVLARWQGRRFDDLANTRELGGYFTLDLAGELALGRALSLQTRVTNVLDRRYETARLFNQPGRQYFITLRYRPARN